MTVRQKIVGCYALIAVALLACCALVIGRLWLPVHLCDSKAAQIEKGMTPEQVANIMGLSPDGAFDPRATRLSVSEEDLRTHLDIWGFGPNDRVFITYSSLRVDKVIVSHASVAERLGLRVRATAPAGGSYLSR